MDIETSISSDEYRAVMHPLFASLGIPADRYRDVKALHNENAHIHVELYRHHPNGKPVIVRRDQDVWIAVETYDIKIDPLVDSTSSG